MGGFRLSRYVCVCVCVWLFFYGPCFNPVHSQHGAHQEEEEEEEEEDDEEKKSNSTPRQKELLSTWSTKLLALATTLFARVWKKSSLHWHKC